MPDPNPPIPDTRARPRLLDLFCKEGGAAEGYSRAGFDVVGIDIEPQPLYPFRFFQAEALEWVRLTFNSVAGSGKRFSDLYDVVHASPPCQAFTQMSARWRGAGGKADSHADWLAPTRALLPKLGVPYVIENVPGARNHMQTSISLHGGMFGLGVNRPRLFESNVMLLAPTAPRTKLPVGVYGKPDGRTVWRYRNNGNMKGKSLIRAWKSLEEGSEAMGIDWMDVDGLREAIPPAYTEFIGTQLLAHVNLASRAVEGEGGR